MQNRHKEVSNEELRVTSEGSQFVTFSLEDEEYGVEILKVQEIIGYTKITHVPNTPEFIKGVINLRGVIIPIIDLRIKFNMAKVEYNQFTVIIVVEVNGKIMGIVVDAVSDVLTLTGKEIQEIPDFYKLKADYLRGMGKSGERMILLLDIDKILSFEECSKLEEISGGEGS